MATMNAHELAALTDTMSAFARIANHLGASTVSYELLLEFKSFRIEIKVQEKFLPEMIVRQTIYLHEVADREQRGKLLESLALDLQKRMAVWPFKL